MKKISTLLLLTLVCFVSKAAISFYAISAVPTTNSTTIYFSISNSTSPFNTSTKILYGTSAASLTNVIGPVTYSGSTVTTSQIIGGLTANTTYFYQLKSGTTTSAILSFTTLNTLPLTLTKFVATTNDKLTILNWQTSNEINVSHFNIQQSNNGIEFSTIGKVNAGKSEYSFNHSNYTLATNYYRLQIVDNDGKTSYSKTVKVDTKNKQNFTTQLQTNIVKNNATLYINTTTTKTVNISVCNSLGAVVNQLPTQTVVAGSNRININTNSLTSGLYFITINDNIGNVITEKMVKN